ncbi:MAG: hypothetical protein HZA22_02360 [Nitrospirae bacterium]|nr:hypothetical protein [Nitrospirota bacterium]MBI5696331.1 hypothetical protein [Nitrospirota bacterium]
MAEDSLKGKNIEMIAKDIGDGYVFVSPLFLKRLDQEVLKKLLAAITKTMTFVRTEKFPTGDIDGIKRRNLRLSRLNSASTVIKHFAKERRWII